MTPLAILLPAPDMPGQAHSEPAPLTFHKLLSHTHAAYLALVSSLSVEKSHKVGKYMSEQPTR
jgi:hypothetical protein